MLSIADGELRFYLHGDSTGRPILAAAEPRIRIGGQLGAFRQGMFMLRFRSDPVPGYHVAFELWPVSKNWRDGGVQFPMGAVNGPIDAVIGEPGVPYGNPDVILPTHATFTSWHTAEIQWQHGSVRFFLDGQQVGAPQVFLPESPLRWVLYAGPAANGSGQTQGHSGYLRVAWLAAYVPRASVTKTRTTGSSS